MARDAGPFETALGLQRSGQLAQAERLYRQILQADPQHADALHMLGTLAYQGGHADMAADLIRQAIALRPDQAAYHNNLGEMLRLQDQMQHAEASYRRALELEPRLAAAHYNLGLLLGHLRPADAQWHYEQAISIDPGHALAHNNLANLLRAQGHHEAAVAAYQTAIRVQPTYADAYANLAIHLSEAGQTDAALACCQSGLSAGAASPTLWGNLAVALMSQGRGTEAIGAYRRALSLGADAQLGSNYLYALNFVGGESPQVVFDQHRQWARQFAEPLTAQRLPHDNDRTADRRLRVGYVSPYFRQHAVNFFVEPLLNAHDRRVVEVFAYSSLTQPDDTTHRLQRTVDQWRDVARASDAELARQVRADRIDILIDLSGHMGQHRLLAFARRPAPVQVTYLGYQNTTGMSAIDYRLTDALADPPGVTDAFYTETLVRLPRAFFCYDPLDNSPVTPLPARSAGYVTFGSFNNFAKVQPDTIDAWLQILARVERSRLLALADRGGYVHRHLHSLALQRDIDPARIDVCDKLPRHDYLSLVARADIALDPFPMNGHTTTCDAVWMGVPVVMLLGATYASRFGGSVLANVGLEEPCMANSIGQYVDKAVRLANNVDELDRLREQLRPRMAASPLRDAAGFARHLELAYRQMWHTWCKTAS
jgi:predicted O-linked N-acetylglucosamine transferase (SPINDLY family)